MHKLELIAYLAKKNRRSQSFYHTAITELLEGITEQLKQGKGVNLTGFGSFTIKTKKGGKAINFRTKKPVTYKDYRQVFFHEGKHLKKAVRKK